MQIKIIDIGAVSAVQKGNNSWNQYEVTYKDLEKGKVTGKRLVSFDNPTVYAFFQTAHKDDVVNVSIKKNEKTGFWDWIAAEPGEWNEAAQAVAKDKPYANSTGKTYTPSGKPIKDYETAAERAEKQRFIINQSSVSNAISLHGEGAKLDTVLTTAAKLVEWVNTTGKQSAMQGIVEMKDDTVD